MQNKLPHNGNVCTFRTISTCRWLIALFEWNHTEFHCSLPQKSIESHVPQPIPNFDCIKASQITPCAQEMLIHLPYTNALYLFSIWSVSSLAYRQQQGMLSTCGRMCCWWCCYCHACVCMFVWAHTLWSVWLLTHLTFRFIYLFFS